MREHKQNDRYLMSFWRSTLSLIEAVGLIVRHQEEMGKFLKVRKMGFPGGTVVENLPANAGDTGSSPGLGGSHMPRSN